MALNFPAKIYQILENESSDIIRWHPNGAAFRIVDHGRFEREIIPKYFRHNQISSVQRQLNLYGFKCVSRGEDKGAFYHAKFKRGDWEVVKKITRYAPMKKPNEGPTEKKESTSTPTTEQSAMGMQAFNALTGAANAELNFPQTSTYQPHFDRYGFPIISATDHNYLAPTSTQGQAAWQWMHPNGAIYHQPRYIQLKGGNLESNELHNTFSHNFAPTNTMSTSTVGGEQDNVSTTMGTSETSSVVEEPLKEEPQEKVVATQSTATQNAVVQNNKPDEMAFIKFKNSVVTVDPYFDLDDEFDLFASDTESSNSDCMSITEKKIEVSTNKKSISDPSPSIKGPLYMDMGVNTDISQSNLPVHHLDEYQIFAGVYMA